LLIALVHALKHQLRQTNADTDMKRLLSNSDNDQIKTAVFKPIMILKKLGYWVKKAKVNGKIDSIIQSSFDINLNKLSDIIGGCERIASTPIPYTYNILLHRTVYIYCFLLPFGFVESMVWTMPFVVVFITYTFVALEAIADELEEPFGIQPNDLALEAMSEMIEKTLDEINNKQIQPSKPTKEYYII
jgi:putative membrane protein